MTRDVLEVTREFNGPGEVHMCWACGRPTRWTKARGNFTRCDGCGDRFPCTRRCDHLDCHEVLGTKPAILPAPQTDNETKEETEMKRTKKAKPKSKICRTCGTRKPVATKTGTNFWANSNAPDGLRDECKDCFYAWRHKDNKKKAANG